MEFIIPGPASKARAAQYSRIAIFGARPASGHTAAMLGAGGKAADLRRDRELFYSFPHRPRRTAMAKGQMRKSKEARKPKKEKPKAIAANPSMKGGQRGLENLKND
jgi:hypothetical protein